jgi:nicotinamide-nucleotide amidase
VKSAIITIGDEILIGQVSDTNAVWIAQELNKIGVQVGEMVTVSDEASQIRSTLDRYMGHYGLLIMTGGLGPTKDDLTKETLAEYFESKMTTNQEVLEKITNYFRERGRGMIASNLQQAEVPEACRVLMNNHGTAPGMWFLKEGTILVSLPGVPYEMKGLMADHVIPELCTIIKVPEVVHRTIMTQGVPESYLAALLNEWESALPACVKLAYLPRPGIVRLRLTVVDKCARDAEELLEVIISKLLDIIPQHIFGFEDISLEEALGNLLRERKLSLATAESCTGGSIAGMLTSVPGSSDYFAGGVIAYANQVKMSQLDVDPLILEDRGAVSREVVEQMALNVSKKFATQTAIATSGIAGPGGGTAEKPVGTTWICVVYKDTIYSKKFSFGGTRDRIVSQANNSALQLLRRLILGSL